MPMKNPPHPGRSIRSGCIEPLGLTVTEAASRLGVTRQQLTRVIQGQSGISPEMAIRLEKMGWSTARAWVATQAAYDLAQAEKKSDRIKVTPCKNRPEPVHV